MKIYNLKVYGVWIRIIVKLFLFQIRRRIVDFSFTLMDKDLRMHLIYVVINSFILVERIIEISIINVKEANCKSCIYGDVISLKSNFVN